MHIATSSAPGHFHLATRQLVSLILQIRSAMTALHGAPQSKSHSAADGRRSIHAGCLFTGFWSTIGAAWSINAITARSNDLPTAASFRYCAFTANVALRSGGAIFVERSGALRLEGCTFDGNAAPDGPDIAAQDEEPDVFSSPPITVFSEGVPSSAASQDVPSRPLEAAANFDFLGKNDEFDASIATVRLSQTAHRS